MSAFDLFVPATSANLGPGLDAMGLALPFGNRFRCQPGESGYRLVGEGEGRTWSAEHNLFLRAARLVAERCGRTLPPFGVVVTAEIPMARGLGSSASAVVAGVLVANRLLGADLAFDGLLAWASELEGHPDNVAPAMLGGVTVAVDNGERVLAARVPLAAPLSLVVAIPDFELATRASRAVLPLVVPRSDAVYNVGRAALLGVALVTGRHDFLVEALRDRLHEPYRLPLVPGMAEVAAAARSAGAWGVTLSGAGPSLLAWVPGESCEAVALAMREAWSRAGIASRTRVSEVNPQGARFAEP